MVYLRKRKSTGVSTGRVAKKPRLTTRRVATIAKRAVMKVSETKKHSFEITESVISTNTGSHIGSPVQLAATPGHGGRVGHKVNPIGLDIRGHLVAQPTTSAIIVRVMVVRYKDNGANLNAELLETNGGNVGINTNDISKMYRRINSDSFEVMASKYVNLVPLFNGGKTCKMFKLWVPLKKLRTLTYEGTAATTPRDNDLAIVVYGADADNDNAFLYELSYNSTFYYKDP